MIKAPEFVTNTVRGIPLKLVAYTRSLELCARMNYETENLDFIDTIPDNEVLYDLGACEGRFSVYAGLKGIKVIAFEPEEKNFKALKENLLLNNLVNNKVIPIHAGVGKKNQNAVMNIGQPWEGGHQKVIEHEGGREDLQFKFIEQQKVDIVSLDDVIREKNLPFPNFIKIDIDGSEIPFLEGADKTLSDKKLRSLIFELDKADKNYAFILSLLKSKKFIIKSEYLVPNEKNLYNIIFVREQ